MEKEVREGKMWVSKQYKNGDSELSDERVLVDKFEGPVAEVSVAMGLTVNLGNYESMRIDVGVKLPCYKEELEDAQNKAFEIVERELYKKKKELDSVL